MARVVVGSFDRVPSRRVLLPMNVNPHVVKWLTSLHVSAFKGAPRPHEPALMPAVLEGAGRGTQSATRQE